MITRDQVKSKFVDGTWEGSVQYLHKLCNQAMKKARQHRLHLEYDDLFQEASLSFMDCRKTFNPDKGVKFITYLGYAVINRLNRITGDCIKTQMGLSTISIDNAKDEDGATLHEQIADDQPGAEEMLEREQCLQQRMARLSPVARMVINMTALPPPELVEEFEAFRTRCARERELHNVRSIAPRELNSSFILAHYLPAVIGLSLTQRRALNLELNRFAEHAAN